MKLSRRQLLCLVGSAAMLLCVLCLPLVRAMSYRWGLFELPHKIGRLVSSAAVSAVALLLLALLLLAPVALAVASTWKDRRPLPLVLLPAVAALLMVAGLLTGGPAAPALGLWAYLLVALGTAACLFISRNTKTL